MHSLRFLIEKDGQPSKTAVLLLITFGMVAVKYMLGGMTIGTFTFSPFDANGSLALLGTVAALYFGANNVRIGGVKLPPTMPPALERGERELPPDPPAE